LTVSEIDTKPLARTRKSVKKRDAIIRAAIEIINAKTFAQATMTDIAASLDLRDATLYYYFPNKQALVYECHVQSLARFERLLIAADAEGGTGIVKLRRFIVTLLEDSEQNGAQLYFGDHSYLETRQRETIDAWAEKLRSMLEQFFKTGVEDGSIVPCDTEVVVQFLIGMLIWLAKWAPGMKRMRVGRLMNAIDAFSFHGLENRT
jgi:AcrR family transcriptional regulator